MIKGKTVEGFEFELDDNVVDDWELLEKLNAIDNGDTGVVVEVAKILLGDKQLNKLKEHVRNKEGKVTITAMSEQIGQIFEACDSVKN